jgi:branched-chain amino acid transport system ATP-binding protein
MFNRMATQSPINPPANVPSDTDVLVVRDATAHYGQIQVLHGVSLTLHQGRLASLIGANGAGKTTLLRMISGTVRCTGGSISANGMDITRLVPDQRVRIGICQVPEGRQIFGPLTVQDNLLLGGYLRTSAERAQSLDEIFTLFPVLAEKRNQPSLTLSGGQQQMLAIGRALMGRPKILLLDEPSMGLSPVLVQEVFATIERLRAGGLSILLIEQNAEAALSVADFGYVLESGRIALQGPGPELLCDDRVQRVYLGA